MGKQATPSSTPRAGLVLADSEYEVAATRHLQRRLRLLYGVMAFPALVFYLVDQELPLVSGGWSLDEVTKPGALVHLGVVLVASLIFVRLSVRPVPHRLLRFLDAIALYLGAGASLAVYALLFEEGPRDVVALLALFVVARAVIVPSTLRATLCLGLPIPAALYVIDRSFGTAYTYTGEEITDPATVASIHVWNQIVLLFGIAVAAVASYVSTALRTRLEAAHRTGRYHLDEKIGEGQMGEVYRATHAMLSRPTAIKLLRPEILGEDTIERFDREVRLASRLAHANTIRIFDYGRTPEGVFYYAMEYVNGENLERLVERHGPLPPARVVHVLRQVCASLAEAHDLGLVHRDVKAGNIMLCEKGGEHDVVKLLDFGLAKDLREASSSRDVLEAVCGTPETIAPEVLRGESAGPACDLYAVGAVGLFLLTGRPIFDASTTMAFLRAHLEEAPIPPAARGVEVPAELEALLMRCLAKEPADRPSSAARLAHALATCQVGAPWTETEAAAWWATFAPPGPEGGGVVHSQASGSPPRAPLVPDLPAPRVPGDADSRVPG